MSKIIISKETKALTDETKNMLQTYEKYKITDSNKYVEAGKILQEIKDKAKKLDEVRKGMTRPIDESKSKIMDFFRDPVDYLKRTAKLINNAMAIWDDEQERKRRIAQAKLDEKARKEKEKLEERARKAEAKGNTEKAEELQEQAEEKEYAVPIAPATTSKVDGLVKKVTWKARVTDMTKLPDEYIVKTPNLPMLNAVAKSVKDTKKIPGVEFYSDKSFQRSRY